MSAVGVGRCIVAFTVLHGSFRLGDSDDDDGGDSLPCHVVLGPLLSLSLSRTRTRLTSCTDSTGECNDGRCPATPSPIRA